MDNSATNHITAACDIATGAVPSDPAAIGKNIRAAHKDLNCKGRGPCWYRMVYRNKQWEYFSDERLPGGNYLARDRRATVHGYVYLGELVCQHDRGKPIDAVWLACEPDEKDNVLVPCEYSSRRDGAIEVTLPNGQKMTVPNPRK